MHELAGFPVQNRRQRRFEGEEEDRLRTTLAKAEDRRRLGKVQTSLTFRSACTTLAKPKIGGASEKYKQV